MRLTFPILTICFLYLLPVYAEKFGDLDTGQIENLTGNKGELLPSTGVFKVTVPHPDLKVTTLNIMLTPELGLRSWADFRMIGDNTEVVGEVVVFEDQVNHVIKASLDNGLNVNGLYSPFLWNTPKVMHLQIEGNGTTSDVAKAVGAVFESIKKSSNSSIWAKSPPYIDTRKTSVDSQNLETILGKKGVMKDGVFKVEFENQQKGGLRGRASFAGSHKLAVVLGEFFIEEGEVQNVLKMLIKKEFLVLSLHKPLKAGNQNIQIIHYLKHGKAVDLAKDLKDNLESINGGDLETSKITVKDLLPEEKSERLKKF